MIKAVTTTLSLALFLHAATPVAAQQSIAQTAEEESIRRQEATILLRKTLTDAQAAQKRNDLASSAKLYEEAYTLVMRIGVGIEQERKQTIGGLSSVRFTLADKAKKSGNLKEADAQVSRVLRIDPLNSKAIALKKEVDRGLEAQKGRVPSEDTMARLPEFKDQNIKTGTKVQDAIVLYQAGKLDEAEAKLNEAIKEEPTNRAAFYYLTLVKNAKSNEVGRRRILDGTDALLDVQKAWTAPTQRLNLPTSNPFARTNTVYTGAGRQAIYAKLDKIRLDEVFFPGVSLIDVARNLTTNSILRDPEKVGINFIVSPIDVGVTLQQPALGGGFDPNTGQPTQPQPTETPDPKTIQVSIDPALRNMRLADVLEAITMVTDKPVKYSVTDWAVVFSVKVPEPLPLFTRTFKVNPNTFLQGLESVSGLSLDFAQSGGQGGGGAGGGGGGGGGAGGAGGAGGQGGGLVTVPRVDVSGLLGQGGQGGGVGGGGGGGGGAGGQGTTGFGITGLTRTNTMDTVQLLVRNFFTSAGVDLGGTNSLSGAQGKAVFYNDRSGDLFVRATATDLDIIEAAIHVLDAAPPQILIEAKFAEISQSDTKALGTDWRVGNMLGLGGKLGVQGGSAPSFPGASSPANPSGIFPGTAGIPTALPAESDTLLTTGLRNSFNNISGTDSSIPAVMTMTGILTDPQFRMVLRAIEQREGADILAAPKVVALSGRQAQLSAVDIPTIVTGLNTGGQVGGGGANANTGAGGGNAAQQNLTFTTQQFPTGPSLDVIPYVSSDGFTVQMTILPVMTEFLGYDEIGGRFRAVSQLAVGGTVGAALTAETPLPRIRVRQVITHAIVWDGQTVVLGGLISEDVRKTKDKVPVLGDIPLLGKLFTSESNFAKKKNLVIFVTPTIIDPSGNRIHSPDRLPYDPNVVPIQKAMAPTR